MSGKNIKISLLQSQEFPDYVVRQFTLKKTDHPNERVVVQFQYLSWFESGIPKDSSVLLSFINKINKWHVTPKGPKVRVFQFFYQYCRFRNTSGVIFISQCYDDKIKQNYCRKIYTS